MSNRVVQTVSVLALLGVAAACGTESGPAAANPTAAASAAASAGAQPATAAGTRTREVELVPAVRPRVDRMTEALKKGDVVAARQAYEAYDAGWNGIEVYINVRSRQLYADLETDLQAKIAAGLEAQEPKLATLVPISEALAKKYDEAIVLVQQGPALSPLFDDLATLRIVRSDLRIVTAALNAGDAGKARTAFDAFKKRMPTAESLIKIRSVSAATEVASALSDASAKFEDAKATANDLKPVVTTLTARYNFGVNLLNAAARNADLAKQTYTESDGQAFAALNDVVLQLRRSQLAWDRGDYATAAAAAALTTGANFERAKVALATRAADAAMKTALDGYAGLAGAAGDAAKVRAANRAAAEAVAVGQQALVGQFWTEPRLQAFIATLPKS